MAGQMKPSYRRFVISISVLSFLLIGWTMLFAFSVTSFLVFLFPELIAIGVLGIVIYKLVKYRKSIKEAELEKAELAQKSEEDIIKLYGLAGIPILRDENGKIKDIYELLGISPEYDEDGNRILTVYEQLGIVPRFTNNGTEIPSFLSIKNRIKKFIKTEKSVGHLTRKLSDKEREELQIRRILEEKKKEAEIFGNKSKAQAIQKTLDSKKQAKDKKAGGKKQSSGPAKIKLAVGKPVAAGKIAQGKGKAPSSNLGEDLSKLSFSSAPSKILVSKPPKQDDKGKESGFDTTKKDAAIEQTNKQTTEQTSEIQPVQDEEVEVRRQSVFSSSSRFVQSSLQEQQIDMPQPVSQITQGEKTFPQPMKKNDIIAPSEKNDTAFSQPVKKDDVITPSENESVSSQQVF